LDKMKSTIEAEQTLETLIWKIDRFAIHDGPGIRTNIYFKGCPLRCLWCSNPEGQREKRELAFSEDRCTGCGLCFDSCSREAIKLKHGKPAVDLRKCDLCEQCVSICPTTALYIYGKSYSLPQIMDVIERDRHIYRTSGGGITCTGGEPFLQVKFLQLLLAKCHEVGIHTTVETCGYADQAQFREILANIDWLFFDFKHIDSTQHMKLTGRDNDIIVSNLRIASSMLGQTGRVLAIRQVVVPGYNDGNNIIALGEMARGLPHLDLIELLPYHAYGSHKYKNLGRKYHLDNLEPPSEKVLLEYKNVIESYGIKCKIGGL